MELSYESVPFSIHVPDEQLARLKRKLEDYELPESDIIPNVGWEYGVSLEWIKMLKKYWLDEYDWREAENAINRWPNYKVNIEDDLQLHYVHQRSARPDAIPLVIIHGWPGTFFEFEQIIEPLTNPPADKQAFHVVIPSVPGFGFSSVPHKKGWTVSDSARVFDKLVTQVLGYTSYAVQGGDWGSIISTLLSDMPHCKAVHLNMCTVPPPVPYALIGLLFALPSSISTRIMRWYFTPEEYKQMIKSKNFVLQGGGYFGMQATQPFTIGLALNDSPMGMDSMFYWTLYPIYSIPNVLLGLLIWIGEKYHTHVDPNFKLSPFTLLTTISIYYHTKTFASSCLPYFENKIMFTQPPARITDSLLGVSIFSHDILILPKSWLAKWHRKKLAFYRAHEEGGHFPALDNPDGLVEDLREFLGKFSDLFHSN